MLHWQTVIVQLVAIKMKTAIYRLWRRFFFKLTKLNLEGKVLVYFNGFKDILGNRAFAPEEQMLYFS